MISLNNRFLLVVILAILLITNLTKSQEDLGTIEIIGTSPIPGTGIDKNRVPNSTQSLNIDEKDNFKSNTLTDLLGERLVGVTVKDLQNSPFQKNLDYRGFTASPLLGESQGLAIYLNGIRSNEGIRNLEKRSLLLSFEWHAWDLQGLGLGCSLALR